MKEGFGEGSIIEVDAKEGVVLFLKKHDNKDYALVQFENVKLEEEIKIYEVVDKDNELYFKENNDENLYVDVFAALMEDMQEKMS